MRDLGGEVFKGIKSYFKFFWKIRNFGKLAI